jgi:hypothetical protein
VFGCVLEQKCARAGAQRLVDVFVSVKGGEDDHAWRLVDGGDAACALDPVDARHAHVHQHDVGLELGRALGRLGAVAGLADHLEVRLAGQDHAKPGAHQALIVGEQDADHRAGPSGRRARTA